MKRLLVAMITLLLFSSLAAADERAVQDGRDVDREMDPVEASHGHHDELRGILVHLVTTAEPWDNASLYKLVLKIWFSTHSQKPHRKVVVSSNPSDDPSMSSWAGVVYDKKARVRGHANVWRPDDHSIRIELSKWLLKRKVDIYHWVVIATSACQAEQEGELCGGPKKDRVPDKGKVRHQL